MLNDAKLNFQGAGSLGHAHCSPVCSGGTSFKIWGERGARKILRGEKSENASKKLIFLSFYAEIVKFDLILTHLSLFNCFGGKLDVKKIFGGISPVASPLLAWAIC